MSSRNNSAVTPYFEALGGVAVLGVSDGVTIVTFTEPSVQSQPYRCRRCRNCPRHRPKWRSLLRSNRCHRRRDGNFELAAVAFTVHLRQEDQNQFTAAIGLFCDRNNVAAHVVNSGYAPELFLLSVPRVGQSCFGIYWGLFGSRAEAQRGIETMPSGIRTAGPVVMPISRVVR